MFEYGYIYLNSFIKIPEIKINYSYQKYRTFYEKCDDIQEFKNLKRKA